MTTINDIMEFFETFAPLETQMDFDNAGLLVGSRNTVVTKVLVALDITFEVVLEAEKLGCELIISHHPVIFNPIRHLSAEDVAYHLVSYGISALCMHTNLDLAENFGVNTALANAVGVNNARLAKAGECLFTGTLEKETDIADFAANVKKSLGCLGLRYTDVKKSVRTVAISSGAGGSNVFAASALSADVLLTGEIRHHEILAANSLRMDIIDAGHFKTEDVVIYPLVKKLSGKFPETVFIKSPSFSDRVKYL